mmetsp:Transcript_56649/g.120290  ORF Transcript_56649/g.120290 Transcript_56649/m.120290 type:complete len:217 (-) Transcript_56649:60-710(-)
MCVAPLWPNSLVMKDTFIIRRHASICRVCEISVVSPVARNSALSVSPFRRASSVDDDVSPRSMSSRRKIMRESALLSSSSSSRFEDDDRVDGFRFPLGTTHASTEGVERGDPSSSSPRRDRRSSSTPPGRVHLALPSSRPPRLLSFAERRSSTIRKFNTRGACRPCLLATFGYFSSVDANSKSNVAPSSSFDDGAFARELATTHRLSSNIRGAFDM